MMLKSTMKNGFTLLELAVVLVLVSLLTGFALKVAKPVDCYANTRAQERDIQDALESFVRANNRYPLPAPRNIGVNDPSFGREVALPTDTNIDRVVTASPVLIGALPFSTLSLANSYASDCWGNKFTYMVTEALTSNTTYMSNTSRGSITVDSGTIASGIALTSNAAYAVISHGENALGASARNYSGSKKSCNTQWADAAVTRIDKENCDTSNDKIYVADFNNGENAPNYFDDVVIYASKTGYTGCLAGTVSWTGGCSGPVSSALANGASVVVANTAGGYDGSATATCTNGTLSAAGSCTPTGTTCGPQAVNWSTNCNGSTKSIMTEGEAVSVNNASTGYTGSVTVTCTSGSLVQSSPSCASSINCAAQTIGWNTYCYGLAPALANGDSSSVSNSAPGYTGSVTATCYSGTLAQTGPGCAAVSGCSGQNLVWSTNCAGVSGSLANGGSATISNTTSGYSGAVTVSCSNGTLTQSSPSCSAVSSNCSSQLVSWDNCSAMSGSIVNGATASVSNTASGYTGTATAACNNGTVTASGSCYADCPAQSLSWSTNCKGTTSTMNSGSSQGVSNDVSGYTGSVTASCNNGVIAQSDPSCTVVAPSGSCTYRWLCDETAFEASCAASGGTITTITSTWGCAGGTEPKYYESCCH